MRRTGGWLASGALILGLFACSESPSPSPSPPAAPCQVASEPELPFGDSVVVSDLDAPCTIEFREVVRLVGPDEGPDPREPVALGPEGTFVTPTYDPGEVAIWSAQGEFLRTVGEGPGEGPGEFPHVSSLLVDSDSTIHILPGHPYWHRYAWSGAFLETVRTPTAASTTGMTMAEDETLITPAMTGTQPGFFVWPRGADGVRFVEVADPFQTERGPANRFVRAAPGVGVWSVYLQHYILSLHDPSSFEIVAQVARDVEWFPGEGASPAIIFDFTVDDRGLLWVLIWVDAPDAPSTPQPQATSEEERRAIVNEYRDSMIEVLTPDGQLFASRTYEDIHQSPRPITVDRWYLVEDHPVPTLVILEPNLVER
jgi:hypothetical protein